MTLTFKEVSEIMKIIDASECEEVVLELEDFRLVVRRGGTDTPPPIARQETASAVAAPSAPPSSTPIATSTSAPSPASAQPEDAKVSGTEVRAPMVGSFYRRPSPDQPAFVELETKVQPGDPLCLIEVMKLYTTIEATVAGTVKQIAAEDGQLVEFDQLLFVIASE